jgi:Uma2 family endonuclease
VVEVAESSLAFDRTHKASLYARGGVTDYWIVNLVDRILEVHRAPVEDAAAPFRWRYRAITRLGPGASVSPLGLPPTARLAVADLLP